MTNNEKLKLIREISTRPEVSNTAAYAVVAGGAVVITAIAIPVILGVIGPVMLAFGVGGTGILLARNLFKKSRQNEGE